MREAPDGRQRVLTLLVTLALSTLLVVLGLVTEAKQLSYPGLALWFVALSATAVWLVLKTRGDGT